MHKSLLIGLILTLLISGCATTEGVSQAQFLKLQNRIGVLEEELRQKEEENLSLKERIAELERTVIKMPTAKYIQTALKNAGFYRGEIDGKMGSKTNEAIRKFQEANGLVADGVIGSKTWEKLQEYLRPLQKE